MRMVENANKILETQIWCFPPTPPPPAGSWFVTPDPFTEILATDATALLPPDAPPCLAPPVATEDHPTAKRPRTADDPRDDPPATAPALPAPVPAMAVV